MKRVSVFHVIIATGFGSGFSPLAPGTAGAFVASIIWVILLFLFSTYIFPITILLICLFTILGIWSSNVLEPVWGKDPSRIVVDEMVGVWIPLLIVNKGELENGTYFWYVLAAFVLFRLFDIIKPFGVRKMEKLKGGWGIMMDDILAGIYSLLVLFVAKWLIG